MEDDISVSIICTTYNQVDYIRDALEGFVSQITTFPYEIIVHDDASNDGTSEVVAEYKNRYPSLFVVIQESENQHSKGVKLHGIIAPFIRGKYVAICEGDDYWTDCNKLQSQYDYMESHHDCALCCHNVQVFNCIKGKYVGSFSHETTGIIPLETLIERWSIPTASFFYKSESYLFDDPVYSQCATGDEARKLYLALRGHVYYDSTVRGVYRKMAKGSWSSRIKFGSDGAGSAKKYSESYIRLLDHIDDMTDGAYSSSIQKRKAEFRLEPFLTACDYKSIKRDNRLRSDYTNWIAGCTPFRRLWHRVRCFFDVYLGLKLIQKPKFPFFALHR